MNEAGQIVGLSDTTNGTRHIFLQSDSKMLDIGPCTDGSYVHINRRGEVAFTTGGHACVWDKAKGKRDLGTLGGEESQALGLNNKGQVIGWSPDAAGNGHIFVFESGKLKDEGTLSFPGAVFNKDAIRGFNDLGQAVGIAIIGKTPTPFFWDGHRGMALLNNLSVSPPDKAYTGFVIDDVVGINNKGQILGLGHSTGVAIQYGRAITNTTAVEPVVLTPH